MAKQKGDVRESAHKIWLAGLGALKVAEEEGSKLFKTLVEQGERFESAGKERLKEAKRGADEAAERARRVAEETAGRARRAAEGAREQIGGALDDTLAKALHRIGVPTREEIAALSRRIEELTRAVERVQVPRAAKAAKPPGSAGRPAAGGGSPKKPPTPRKITTTKDVTTSADVVTKP